MCGTIGPPTPLPLACATRGIICLPKTAASGARLDAQTPTRSITPKPRCLRRADTPPPHAGSQRAQDAAERWRAGEPESPAASPWLLPPRAAHLRSGLVSSACTSSTWHCTGSHLHSAWLSPWNTSVLWSCGRTHAAACGRAGDELCTPAAPRGEQVMAAGTKPAGRHAWAGGPGFSHVARQRRRAPAGTWRCWSRTPWLPRRPAGPRWP